MLNLKKSKGEFGVAPRERALRDYLKYGVALVDKPCGPSSHEVSNFAKRILRVEKTGHSGTLDPNVSGVLPVLLEEACKASNYLMKQRKTYQCIARFARALPRADVERAFSHFRGKIYQTPPLASAVAKRLRVREVYSLEIEEVDVADVLFECDVEAGFYVRKLVTDLSEVLATPAEMLELRRTIAAGFGEKQCATLQELSDYYWLAAEKGDGERLRRVVIPVEEATALKRVVIDDNAIKPVSTGADLAVPGICSLDETIAAGEAVQVLSLKGELVCFARALLGAKEIAARDKGIAFDVERVLAH